MRSFIEKILKHSKFIVFLYCVLAIICMFLSQFVGVNYVFADYLPSDAKSTIALNIMEDEYATDVPNARIMIQDVTIPEALEFKNKMLKIDGVEDVTWLDDSIDLTEPLETIDQKTRETYYKDNNAVFTVTIDKDKTIEAKNEIYDLSQKKISMTGDAISTAISTEKTGPEIKKIAVIAVVLIFAILFYTTTSWAEPLMFMASIGIAVLINMGTNIIFGEISFVTNAAGSILQLAVSMDYSIFLLNRFNDYRKNGMEPKEAMVEATVKSFSSISASALTTIIGFAALILMRFKIGQDMGLVLSKAIVISLIVVFTLLPALIMNFYPWIDKLAHRSLTPNFKSFSHLVTKVKKPMIMIFLIVMIPSLLLQSMNSFLYGSSQMFGKGTQYYQETKAIEDVFGKSNSMVLMVPKGNTAKEDQLSQDLHSINTITDIVSYVDTAGSSIPKEYVEPSTLKQLDSENYTRMVLNVQTDYESDEAFDTVKQMRDIASKYYDDYHLAGAVVTTYDLKDITTADMTRVNAVAILAVFLVMLFTMKSYFLPIILVLIIETAIWINLSIPALTGNTLFYIAYLIISSIQLGATVDYAICLSSRYIETRESRNKEEALDHTIRYSTLSILTSGSILTIAGFILGKISTMGVLSEIGILLFRGTLLSLIMVLFVLPGLLYVLDKPIKKCRFGIQRKDGEHDEKE